MEFLSELLFHTVGKAFGWLYLFIRYRSKEKRKDVLEKQYGGSYGLVATERILLGFTVLLSVGFLVFIVIVLISVAKKYW